MGQGSLPFPFHTNRLRREQLAESVRTALVQLTQFALQRESREDYTRLENAAQQMCANVNTNCPITDFETLAWLNIVNTERRKYFDLSSLPS